MTCESKKLTIKISGPNCDCEWESSKNSSGYIGQLTYGVRTDVPEGQLRCDGATYTRALLPTFFDEYLVAGKMPTCTMTEYADYLTANNGNCGFIGLDETSEEFRMPTLKDRVFIAQALTVGNFAKFNFDQIVNIRSTGDGIVTREINGTWGMIANSLGAVNMGCLYTTGTDIMTQMTQTGKLVPSSAIRFDASRQIRTGDQVQPPHIQYPLFMTVSNVSVPASEMQYNAFIEQLENKANSDFSNLSGGAAAVVETWRSGTSWYRKWSNGWIEQGGYNSATTAQVNVVFHTPMTNYDYFRACTYNNPAGTATIMTISTSWHSGTGFTAFKSSAATPFYWFVTGI